MRLHGRLEFAPPWWSEDGPQPADTILLGEGEKEEFRDDARAAMEAMDPPTEAMIEAYDRFCDDVCFPSIPAEQALSAMLHAALKP